jgi:hypothetical protein
MRQKQWLQPYFLVRLSISMYSVSVFLILSAQMTVVDIPNDHHFIGYIATIHGHFKDLLSKYQVLFGLTFCVTKAISGFYTSQVIT